MGEETPKFKGQNKNMTQLLLIEYTSRDFYTSLFKLLPQEIAL